MNTQTETLKDTIQRQKQPSGVVESIESVHPKTDMVNWL